MGFDVYNLVEGEYIHKTVFGPSDGHNIFAHAIRVPKNGNLCIFLPNYNMIEEFYLGITENSTIEPIDYKHILPIIFYGNSVTMGISSSKSGNSYPNIISRKRNQDIINLSHPYCFMGINSMAKLIGKNNCDSIIIDYTGNINNIKAFEDSYDDFYNRIRQLHPDKRIILMTSSCFNNNPIYKKFDDIIFETYQNAVDRGDNIKLLNQRELFDNGEYDLVTTDSFHYTDYAMYVVADKICKLLDEY